jgi:hypothetical protein
MKVENGLSLGLFLLLGLTALAALSFDVLVIDSQGLVDLGLESGIILDTVMTVSA